MSKQDKWLKEFNIQKEDPLKFLSDMKTCFCKVCEKSFIAIQKSQIAQHVKSEKHTKNSMLKKKRTATQAQLEDLTERNSHKRSRQDIITKELCEALLVTDIPWRKLVPKFRSFLETHVGIQMPSESHLRKNQLHECYEDVISKIRDDLDGEPIWVGVDETTDSTGRFVAHVMVGKLKADQYHRPYLLDCVFLDHVNSSTISRFVNDSLRRMWSVFKCENFKILISDAAAYMVKSGKELKVFYPNLLHLTCFAHAVHRVCEQVREMFPIVNDLISTVKKVFLKAPSRILIWKENCSLSLPPQPILTRWGTWIQAAIFYAQNFDEIKEVVSKLNSDEALSIKRSKETMENESLQCNLAFIACNLSFLPDLLTQLEKQGLTLKESFDLIDRVKTKIDEIPGNNGRILKDKFVAVMKRNPDVEKLRSICEVQEGNMQMFPSGELSPYDVACLRYCPTVNVDVERSFSIYKNVLTDRRQTLTTENIAKIMVTHCFYNRDTC